MDDEIAIPNSVVDTMCYLTFSCKLYLVGSVSHLNKRYFDKLEILTINPAKNILVNF